MPDFLRRVIDGALERASPIEPRLRSVYEPHDLAAATGDALLAEGAEHDAGPDRGVTDAYIGRGRHAPYRAPMSGEHPSTVEANVHGPDLASDAFASSPARAPVATPDRVLPAERARPKVVDPRRDPPLPARGGLLEPLDAVLVAREFPSATRRPRDGLNARPLEDDEPLRRRAQGFADRPDEAVAPPQPLQGIALAPPTARPRMEREQPPAEPAAHPQEPVVNVSIGRIEIRAVSVRSPAAGERSQGQRPMSLDDYLGRRGGGR